MKLNVGCGREVLGGYVNLDCVQLPGVDVVFDLEDCGQRPLPFGNETFDEFLLSHIIEHIRNLLPMMQELYRVAKPMARMTIRCPHGASDDAFEDPTHVRQMFPNSFGYFSQPFYWRASYNYSGDWQPEKVLLVATDRLMKNANGLAEDIATKRNQITEMIGVLRARKPAREPQKELQVAPTFMVCTAADVGRLLLNR